MRACSTDLLFSAAATCSLALLLCTAVDGGSAAGDTSGRRGRSLLGTYFFQYISAAGGTGSGDGQFSSPWGMTLDAGGNILLADTYNNRVQKLSATGTYIAKFGAAGSGDGQFYNPTDVKVDSSGNIYVADYSNSRVQKFDSSFNYILKFGSSGTGDGQFQAGVGICIDASGNVYTADGALNRVQKFDPSGSFLWASGSTGTGDGQFVQAYSCAVEKSSVYVGDNTGRIQLLSTENGTFQSKFALPGTNNSTSGLFFAADGSLFASQYNSRTVLQLDVGGTLLASVSGQPGNLGPFGVVVTRSVNGTPSTVAVSDSGNNAIDFFERTPYPSPPPPSPPPPSPTPPPPRALSPPPRRSPPPPPRRPRPSPRPPPPPSRRPPPPRPRPPPHPAAPVCRTRHSQCARSADCCPRLACKALMSGRSGSCQPCLAVGQACSQLSPCCPQLRCERAGAGSVCRPAGARRVLRGDQAADKGGQGQQASALPLPMPTRT